MLIRNANDLVYYEEYCLIDKYDNITIAHFISYNDNIGKFIKNDGEYFTIILANNEIYDDACILEWQLRDVYCVFTTDDYLNETAKYSYSNTLCVENKVHGLLNHTFTKVVQIDESIVFSNTTTTVVLAHIQECCENVWIESVNGDLSDLVNTPILKAEEKEGVSLCNTYTWYFYTIATIKGYVDIRFCADADTMYSTNASLTWESVK